MKLYAAAILLVALVGCSPPPQPVDGPPQEPVDTETPLLPADDPEKELGASPASEARQFIYDKPQLVYYRINEH